MKRGPLRDAFNWGTVNWGYCNKSLRQLLDVAPATIARQRVRYAPATCPGSGTAPDGRQPSGERAPDAHVRLAIACRRLVHELGCGLPQKHTAQEIRQLLDEASL